MSLIMMGNSIPYANKLIWINIKYKSMKNIDVSYVKYIIDMSHYFRVTHNNTLNLKELN